MKSYKLILQLIKHPFSEVNMLGGYKITGIKYNNYLHTYNIDSIVDKSYLQRIDMVDKALKIKNNYDSKRSD